MTSPAMGTITFSDNVRIMLNMPAFHPCGVCPTSAAIVPTFSFTSPNIVDRFPLMAPMRISFIHSVIASSMLCIGSYPRFLAEQPGKQGYKGHADQRNAAARHKLCYPQLAGTITLNSGRRSSKNIYEIIKNLPGWGRSFSDLLHFRDWFQIKMNFNRNVSCLIAVYFFMDNDFFNQLV